ncbi:hypothetical protein H311_03519 [Anncaliia algerae PRA109]|nr:hypothetical protein H311_03519 [Anncaliia algerae PRA109]
MDYLISTEQCCVPYILKIETNQPILIYLDDIFEHYQKNTTSINTLMNINNKIIITFKSKKKPSRKNKTRTLFTPHGNRLITEIEYSSLIKVISPFYHEDFNTFVIKNDNESFEYFSPKDFYEAISLLKENKLIDTLFLYDLTKNGKLIIDKDIVSVNDEYTCECCCKSEYLRHLYKLNEINAYITLQRHNLLALDNIVKEIKK